MNVLKPCVCAVGLLSVLGVWSDARAGEVLTGDAAKAKFPSEVQALGLDTASWTTLTNGVEYMFGRFTNLYGYPSDAHFIKIDYAKAPVKMKINENSLNTSGSKLSTTSAAAKKHNALFAINGNMFRWSDDPNYIPYYFTKVDGTVVTSVASGGSGIAFNDDKTWAMGSWNATTAASWANVHTCENILANGKCTLEGDSWKTATPSAGFPFVGKTSDNILWIAIVDGRRAGISPGITYYNGANLMKALGCEYATLYDGGGSTTLVIRNDLLPEATLAYTQHASVSSTDHTTMNFTSSDGSTLAERTVVDQLCFVEAPLSEEEPEEEKIDTSSGFLSYIKTSGSTTTGQRILLDYTPTGDTVVYAKFAPNVVDNNGQCLYCARTKAADDAAALNYNYFVTVSKCARFDYYNKQQNTGESMVANTDYTLHVDRNTGYLYKGTATKPRTTGLTYTSFTAGGPMSLFMSYTLDSNGKPSSWANAANITFYYMRVFQAENGKEVLKLDLVPRRVGDVVGLYDLVSHKFYANEGSGSFVAGPDVDASKVLVVSGTPKAYPNTQQTPAYGINTNVAAGTEIAVSANGDNVVFSDTVRGKATGWALLQNGSTTTQALNFTYTQNGYAELNAIWALENKIEVATPNPEKGTVTGGGWYAAGETVTLTATPNQGETFYGWEGDIGDADPTKTTITVSADQARSVMATFTKTIFVSTTGNDSSANPYDSKTPMKTIEAAYAKSVDGDTIYVAAGTYATTANITITKAITLAGAGMDQTIRKGDKSKITLNNANAVVRDLRVTGYGSGGAVEFTKGGAGGTVLRCDISGNTRTSTSGTGVTMCNGNLIDCVITNNLNGSGGTGVGLYITPSSDCVVKGCLIAGNSTGYGGASGGVGIEYCYPYPAGLNVTMEHCTIVRNLGGNAGGLYIQPGNINVTLRDCLIANNGKLCDATASETEDVCIKSGTPTAYKRVFENVVIAKCHALSTSANYVVSNCLFNVGGGLYDPYAGDCHTGPNSPAFGAATDGTDIGCYQTAHGTALAVGCYAVTNAAIGTLTTTLVGTSVNAGDDVVYAWDLDGDGTYEAEGATVETTFTTLGWQSVRVKATSGDNSVEAIVEHVASVMPATTYVWSKSANPTFPYATWETAAQDPQVGLAAVIDGGKLQFTNEAFAVAKALKVYRKMELCGTGKDNNSVLGNVSGFTVTKGIDEHATGTSIQRTGGDIIPLQLFNTGNLVHSLALGPGRSSVVCIYGESTLSNCVVRYGEYTGGNGNGLWAQAGLITHCVISNNYNYNAANGGEAYLSGTAKLRNSLVTGGLHTASSGTGECGSVYATGDNVEVSNCTICDNTAGYGAGLYTKGKVKVFNNIIRDNKSKTISGAGVDWYDETGTAIYSNNCLTAAHNDGDATVVSAPAFTNNADGTCSWKFEASSPCANAGLNLAWMVEDATDLFGNSRVQGDSVDIGCFEADMSKSTCGIVAIPSEVFAATNITFKAVVTGGSVPKTAQYLWDFDGDGVYEKSGAVVTNWCGEGYHTAKLKIVDGETTLFEVEGASNLVTIYPKTIYFDTANMAAAFPYNTPETAANKMSDVMASAKSGCTIYVLAGRHDCDKQITLGAGISLKAAPRLATRPTLVRQESTQSGSLMIVSGDDAVVEGLVLDDNQKYSQDVTINGGTIRDCVITNGWYTTGSSIGFSMNAGLMDRCVVVRNRGTPSSSLNDSGLIASIAGGTVRNTLFTANYVDDATSGRVGGLICVRKTGVLENCTIVGNTNRTCAVVTTLEGGTVRNCVIYGNLAGRAFYPMARSSTGAIVDDTSGTADFNYNAYQLGEGEERFGANDVVLTASPFVTRTSTRHPEYSPAERAPIVNAGTNVLWMAEGVDFYGFPRIRNGRTDIGACEYQTSGFTVILR